MEGAAARVCREAGVGVTTNTRLSDLNLDHINRHDRRTEVIANGCGGGSATRGRHRIGISFDFIPASPKGCGPIRRSSAPRRTQIQGGHIPRTSPFQTVHARGFRHRDRGPVEPGSNNFPPRLGPDKKQSISKHLPQSCRGFLPSRWSAILIHAARHAFAASLLDLACAGTSNTDGDIPSISQPTSPPTSRFPARP